MFKQIWKIAALILISFFAITACERPASRPPIATPQAIETLRPLVTLNPNSATATAGAVVNKFNQPTQIVTNAAGQQIVITPVPPTPVPTQTPSPSPMPPTPVVTKPAVHAVQSGETIYCLARRYDVDPADILSLNNLTEWSMLSIGDELQIPMSGSWPGPSRAVEGTTHPDTWDVSEGDTVYSVACAYGDMTPEAIIAVNGLKAPYDLDGIKTLQIP